MSIERIGKGNAPPPLPTVTAADKAQRTDGADAPKVFDVRGTERAASTAHVAPAAKAAVSTLDRLRSGEIDLDGYLDLKVNEATTHLQGMRAHEVDGIRAMLREQIAGDPALADLVQRATGQAPVAREPKE